MSMSCSSGNSEHELRKKREEEVKKVAEALQRQQFIAQADAERKAREIVDAAYFKRQAALRNGACGSP